MMRGARAIVLLSVLALPACSDNQPALPPAPEKQEKLTQFQFKLQDARFAVSLPEQAGMRDELDTKRATFDARKGQRLQKVMVLSVVPEPSAGPLDGQHRLRNGSVVNYHRTENAGGGSGGTIATINGRLQIGPHTMYLFCSDQSEAKPFPDWCLDYLDSLEIRQPSSGNG